MRFVSAYGTVMQELRAAPLARDQDVYHAEFALAPFASGEYTIDIDARTEAGVASERVAVRIVP
ncbi:hypothetical protein D3C83_280770 [compost metagenome]